PQAAVYANSTTVTNRVLRRSQRSRDVVGFARARPTEWSARLRLADAGTDGGSRTLTCTVSETAASASWATPVCQNSCWSAQEDLNLQSFRPERNALPG